MSQQQQQQQQHQDPVSCFPCGATTPQSPLLSPRMGQGQSPMLQQNQGPPQTQHQGPNQGGPPSYQPSADLNGWSQPANITSSNRYYVQMLLKCCVYLQLSISVIGFYKSRFAYSQ